MPKLLLLFVLFFLQIFQIQKLPVPGLHYKSYIFNVVFWMTDYTVSYNVLVFDFYQVHLLKTVQYSICFD